MKKLLAKTLLVSLGVGVAVYMAYAAGLTLSQTSAYLHVGQSIVITAYPPPGQYVNVTAVSNSYVAYANANNNLITIYGLGEGSAQITVSTFDNSSATIYVNVGEDGTDGYLTFNPSSLNLNVGQSATVTIYNSRSSTDYYVTSNTNSTAVSTSISGNQLSVSARNPGSSTITVSTQNYRATGSLNVTVNGWWGNPYLVNPNPPAGRVGQYYSYQFQAAGGMSPYTFSLTGGSLPPGLQLSAGGQIYGAPSASGNYYFSLRVQDYYGNSPAASGMSLTVTGGSVAGQNIYNNGTLIQDGTTIYITYKNTKTGFANWTAFSGLGYQIQNVISASASDLSNSGYVVGTPNTAHPWGSWIRSGTTVYFVHQNGLIPISSHENFLNNGGRDGLVVAANPYDFYKPMLDIMTAYDSRLN